MPDKHGAGRADARRRAVHHRALRRQGGTDVQEDSGVGGGELRRRRAGAPDRVRVAGARPKKVGDHWEPKEHKGPSDPQAEQGTPRSVQARRDTAQGVDANASKGHLDEVARRVTSSRDPESIDRKHLVREIEKANARATAGARRK